MWGKNVASEYPGDLGPCTSFAREALIARTAEAAKTEADVLRNWEVYLLRIGGNLFSVDSAKTVQSWLYSWNQ